MADFSRLNPIRLVRRYVRAHHISRAALVAGGIAAAVVFFVIGAGVRLLIGPVSLGPFGSALSDAVNKALPGITVRYDQAAIEWARDEGRVNLVILGTRVFDVDGRIIAQAPKADIDLAAGPFLKGKIVVKRIALVGVQLTLVRTNDGKLRLGVEKDKRESDILKRIADALKANGGTTSSLESFAVRGARLAFYDETTGLFVVAPRADFRLAKLGTDLAVIIDAAVEISGRPAHISADIVLPPSKGRITGEVSITGFEVHSLAENSKAFSAVKDTALKLDITGSFTADGWHLVSADFGLAAKGVFTIPELSDGRIHVSSLRAVGRYDGMNRRVSIENGEIESDKIKARLQGRLDIVPGKPGELAGLRADLRMSKLLLAWPGVFAQPVQFQLVELRGSWNRADRDFIIDHLGVSGSPLAMQISGRITAPQGVSPAVEVSGTIAPLGVRDLVAYWPIGAAAGARDWVDQNMPAGMVGPTSFEIHFPAGLLDGPSLPQSALSVKFSVAGAEINYIKGLTHLTAIRGSGTVTGDTFTADVPSARIGPLAVSGAQFAIPQLSAVGEIGNIKGHIQGAMSDVLTLVDMPPLRYATRFGVTPADSKGNAGVDLTFAVPLNKGVSVDLVKIGVKAAVGGFSVALGPHTRLTDGTVNFDIDNNKLHATGTAGIGGSPSRLTLDWTEDFVTTNALTTRIAIKGSIDEQARAAMGLRLKDFVRGPFGMSGTLTGHRGALAQGNLTFDLTPSNVTLDLIGVNKPAGFPMTARINTAFGPKSTIASPTIRITGPGTSVSATAKFDADGHLVQLQAPTVHIGPQNDFSLNLTRSEAGLDVILRGRSLDGSRLAGRGDSSDEEKFDEPFHINAKLDRLVMRSGVALAPFSLDITGVADRPASMTFSASLSKTATVAGSITPVDAGRRVTISTNDMGLLTRGLFGFNSMRGGKLDFTATLFGKAGQTPGPDTPDFQGKAVLKDFRVVDQPFLARVFTAGSLGGLANLMQGQGIAVDTLELPFSSRNGVISIHDARATGPAIGITGDGYIDRPKNDIALKGTLVPLFGLNSVLGNIPLIGNVLTSKQGEGIFGMSYSVSGNADEPQVSVNPLSVLAPGIFRRIFEGKMPTAAQAPSNAPQNAPKPTTPPSATPVPNTPKPAAIPSQPAVPIPSPPPTNPPKTQ